MTGCYLSYPIDQAEGREMTILAMRQAEKFKQMLLGSGAVDWVFDPGDAITVHKYTDSQEVRQINQFAARRADVMAAFLPDGQPSVGVPMEIDRAVMAGKHVVVFSDASSFMLNYNEGMINRWHGWEDDHLTEALNTVLKMPKQEGSNVEALPVKMLSDLGFMPTRSHTDDAGLDLYVSQDTTIKPGTFVDVPCAIAVELPDWSWAMVTGRSSALRKRGLLVHTGIIDTGYRGPIFAGAWNMTDETVTVGRGERIAQLVVFANHTQRVAPIQVERLNDSARGTSGFGSTGT